MIVNYEPTEEEVALWRALLACPDDDLPRKVLADWLDEHEQHELVAELRADTGREAVGAFWDLCSSVASPPQGVFAGHWREWEEEAEREIGRPARAPVCEVCEATLSGEDSLVEDDDRIYCGKCMAKESKQWAAWAVSRAMRLCRVTRQDGDGRYFSSNAGSLTYGTSDGFHDHWRVIMDEAVRARVDYLIGMAQRGPTPAG